MRNRALIDIFIVGIVFWGIWSLRFAGFEKVGFWAVLVSVAVGTVLLRLRNESWRDIGLKAGGDARFVVSRTAEMAALTLVTGAVVIGIATAIGYPPSESDVLTQQPDTVTGFLLDIFFGVWIGAAICEELLFRGFLLSKFSAIFGSGRGALTLAVLAQGIWFGAGHISQGISGMIMAGTIGCVLGAFFLTRARRALIPMIIGHGLIDTVSLTINFVS